MSRLWDGSIVLRITALKIRRLIGERTGEASTLVRRGTAYAATNQLAEAMRYFTLSAPVLLEVGDKAAAKALSTVGLYYENTREYQKALEFYQQCLKVTRELGDKAAEARSIDEVNRVTSKLP
jgi:tetratricopeptide (TPR) repeat protein